jgi:hypothetical protein
MEIRSQLHGQAALFPEKEKRTSDGTQNGPHRRGSEGRVRPAGSKSSSSVALRKVGVRAPVGGRDIFPKTVQTTPRAQPRYRNSFLGGKASAEVKNEWRYIHTHPIRLRQYLAFYDFMVWRWIDTEI